MRLGAVKDILADPTVHLEAARGSVEANIKYCTKDGDWEEIGSRPVERGKAGGDATRRKYEEARDLAVSGNWTEIPADLLVRHYGNLRKIAVDFGESPGDLSDVCGLWLFGEPGVGKSHRARNLGPSFFPKPLNKWWDGYNNEDIVILDDWDRSTNFLWNHLKIWADKYSFIGESKGGSRRLRPKQIVVTSNYKPSDLITDDGALLEAIERRFTIEEVENWQQTQ